VGDSYQQALTRAETMFNDGLTTMNESTIRQAASLYEQIIQDFPNDPRHFNAYFASAMIHIEYLQGISDYEHVRHLLSLLINNHPSAYPEVTDALLILAQVEYKCLGDYRSAQEHLSEILNNPLLSQELEYRDIEVKVLLAKCRQKLAEYDQSHSLWEEINSFSETYDTEGRLRWHENLDNWQFVDDGVVRLYFEAGTSWEPVLSALRDGLAVAGNTWRLQGNPTVYAFLYASSDSLFDYTLRYDGFALPLDSEMHFSPADINRIEHIAGWLVSARLNTRSDEASLPLIRAGFNHYFMGTRDEVDHIAAKELFFYGELLTDDYLLFPIAYDYTFSDEFSAISSSFMHYLIDDGDVSVNRLREFHRLLHDSPTARILPPMMAEMAKFDEAMNVIGRQGTLVTPAQVYDLFRTRTGLDLGEAFDGWRENLAPTIAEIETQYEGITEEVERVSMDLSTPELALRTYWDAWIHGDIDVLIDASTEEPAEFLRNARDLYIERGILEAAMFETFILPNRGAVMRVVFEEAVSDDRHVFQVRIERGGEFEERTFVIRKEGRHWKVDTN